MEYFVARSMEAARLSGEDLFALHEKETLKGRGLSPWEIQHLFKLPELKERWGIGTNEQIQVRHAKRIADALRVNQIAPYPDFSVCDVEAIHKFDAQVQELSNDLRIDFQCQSGRDDTKTRRLKELMGKGD